MTKKTVQFDEDLERIEDHIYKSTESVPQVGKFLDAMDEAVAWIESNFDTPKAESSGDRSWPFFRDSKGKFRYRIAYILDKNKDIILKRVIDNREANLDLFPVHKLDTYDSDDK